MSRISLNVILATFVLVTSTSMPVIGGSPLRNHPLGGGATIQDIFGRVLDGRRIELVDWEGHMANPAIQLFAVPPRGAVCPANAVLTSSEPRLYFDSPCSVDSTGPKKTLWFFDDSTKVSFHISIYPDRDTLDEDFPLSIEFTDANGNKTISSLNIHVIDQDRNLLSPFKINVDFSQDQTGFFSDQAHRDIVLQAAQDWAYFIGDMNLDDVPAGAEQTWIWNSDGFNSGKYITNSAPYKGFLLYAYGIHSSLLRSGGEASSSGGFQSAGGSPLPLKRSGGVEVETAGNYNSLGWFLTTSDDDWWQASNFSNVKNDLYSIVRHEMGHALFFNPAHTIFGQAKARGYILDSTVFAYHGSNPNIDASDHFNGEIDNAALKGVFGYEYYGSMPARRWIIAKLDLLCIQAIGYKLRKTPAFVPLGFQDTLLSKGVISVPYADSMHVSGGIPSYCWSVEAGSLPDGLTLNSFTGSITGTPTKAGIFHFSVRVRDNVSESPGVTVSGTLNIQSSADVDDGGHRPEAFSLLQNYPNPFNPVTSIEFSIPGDMQQPVSLRVFDVLGRLVATLVDEKKPAGRHVVLFDASGLTSGMYFYRLQAGSLVATKKLIVLK